jgi:alpha-L-rhamnosidase
MQIGDLGVWLYEYLGGIRPDPNYPGFKHILVRPYPVKELSFVKTSHHSPYGVISSEWKRTGNGISLNVTVPPNTSATVWVPAADTAKILESGHPVEKASGVKQIRRENGMTVFEVQSGTYNFTAGS